MKKRDIVLLAAIALSTTAFAQQNTGNLLDVNNISATINANGKLFASIAKNGHSEPGFEVYKSGKHTLNATSLWIGGFDQDNNYHLMAPTYGQWGADAFAGPGMATYDAATDAKWNRVWNITKDEIDAHIANYKSDSYVMPEVIATWPGNGDVALGQMANLAPYFDADANGKYEPAKGDYPVIKGDQAIYFIYNDHRANHAETGGAKLGVEIHGMAYSFKTNKRDEAFNNTVFVEYDIFNRSNNDYRDVYIGLFNDLDMGEPFNDYMGVDVNRNTFFAYNAKADDNEFKGIADDPHMSVKFLNEGLNGFLAYDNDWSERGNPYSTQDYYNYLRGFWKDGQPVTFGGNGKGGTQYSRYMFPGATDPIVGGDWNEKVAKNAPHDRRALGTVGPFNFKAGQARRVALVYNFATTEKKMYKNLDKIQDAYDNQTGVFKPNTANSGNVVDPIRPPMDKFEVSVSPNPMKDNAIVRFDNPRNEEFILQMFDLTGKLIYSQAGITGTQVSIERGVMVPGMYIIELRSGSRRTTAKLVVAE